MPLLQIKPAPANLQCTSSAKNSVQLSGKLDKKNGLTSGFARASGDSPNLNDQVFIEAVVKPSSANGGGNPIIAKVA